MQDSLPAGGLRLCRAGVERRYERFQLMSSSSPSPGASREEGSFELPPQTRACAIDALGSSPDSNACSAIHCCFVNVLVELRVSSSVSHQWLCTGDAPLPFSGSRWPRFPAFSGTIRALRLPALAYPSAYCFRQPAPRVPAGFVSAVGRSRRRTGPATDRGLDYHAGNPPSSVFAHGQGQDLPGSLAIHPVTLRRSTTPDDPLRLANSGASGAAPTRLTMKASSFTDFEAARRFITCCLRFTTGVAARHARLASGWRAAPLPGGGRTRWIATRGFSSCHPPLQGFAWRDNRSVMG